MKKTISHLIYLILAFIVFVLFGCSSGDNQGKNPADVSFPYRWEKGGVRAILIGIKSYGEFGRRAERGYKFIGIYGIYENLTHRSLSYREVLDKGAHIPILKLKTNRGNIYEHRFRTGACGLFASDLRPEENKECWIVFEIRLDEEPIQLDGLESNKVMYVWKIK